MNGRSNALLERRRSMEIIVGRDSSGRWLAVEKRGSCGGVFASREAALRYASVESAKPASQIRISAEPIAFRL